MQQTCAQCSYESPPGARFCRQCGAPLFVESETTRAPTRQYGPAQSAPNPPDYLGLDTGRLHHQEPSPTYAVPTPSQSNTGSRVILAALLFLVLCGVVSVGVMSFQWSRRPATTEEEIERLAEEAAEHAQEAAERHAEAAARQAEAAARQAEAAARQGADNAQPLPPLPPPPPPIPGESRQVTGIEQLKYPGATSTKRVNTVGNEVLKMRTSDDLEKVKQFYREQLGDPTVQIEGSKVVFIGHGQWNTVVAIAPEESRAGGVTIDVVRTRIPMIK